MSTLSFYKAHRAQQEARPGVKALVDCLAELAAYDLKRVGPLTFRADGTITIRLTWRGNGLGRVNGTTAELTELLDALRGSIRL